MQCPVCKTVNLVMSERQGIEIDYCPQCRGVWLDRGELDKIIDRSSSAPAVAAQPAVQPYTPQHQPSHQHPHPQSYNQGNPDHYYPGQHGGHYKKKKREGFLSDLFDFD